MTNDGVDPIVDPELSFIILFAGRCHAVIDLIDRIDMVDGDDLLFGQPIPRDLELLIDSAKRYPPAIAHARLDVEDRRDETLQPAALFAVIRTELENRLRNQPADRAFLAQSVRADEGFRAAGEWVWIIDRVADSAEVIWVGGNFEIYASPSDEFALDEADGQGAPADIVGGESREG